MSSQSDIFISYVSSDREKARELAEDLEAHGYSIWWDRHLLAGESFAIKIDEALRTAKAVIVLWSPEAVSSRWVLGEAETAAGEEKLIPLLLDGTEPKSLPSAGLRAVQSISFRDRAGLHKALQALLAKPAQAKGVRSGLYRGAGHVFRKVRRALSPARVAALAVVALLAIQTVRDVEAWRGISGSTNPGDYLEFLEARAGIFGSFPSAAYFRQLALARLEGYEEFKPISASLSADDFERFTHSHPESMFAQFARIRAQRLRRFESGAYAAVLKDSGHRALDIAELEGLDCSKLWIARNEIYYRLGRCFTSRDGIETFKTDLECPKSCAARRAINALIDENQLQVAQDNAGLIKKREKQLGCRQSPVIPDC